MPTTHSKQTTNCREQRKNIISCQGKYQVMYKCRAIRKAPDFSVGTLKDRKTHTKVLQTQKDKKWQDKLLYLAKLPFKMQ